MRLLTKQEFQKEAEPMFKRVFEHDNGYISLNEFCFRQEIMGRTIIYPYYGEIELPTADAIVAATMNLGDTGCYLWNFLAHTPEKSEHCHIYLSEFKRFCSDESIPEKLTEKFIKFRSRFDPSFIFGSIYSETGKWGIWKWDDGFGILGGPQEFLAEIRQKIPDIDRQVYGLLWELKNSGCLSPKSIVFTWLPRLLNHVYGSEVAERILEEIRTGSL